MIIRFFIIVVGLIFGFFVYQVSSLYTPEATQANGTQIVLIPKGAPLSQISEILERNSIVESSWKFKLLARLKNAHRKLQPGEYELLRYSSPNQALETLVQGKVLLHKVTFPEGWTMDEMANLLTEKKLAEKETLNELLYDKRFVKSLTLPGPNLEGYLFPETYFFSRTDGEKTILETMVEHFFDNIRDNDLRRAEEIGWDLREWITMASIIEKESSDPTEHRRISSVFHNRLKKGMRLQSDPTVIYGIEEYDGNIKKKHLEEKTPYNTYQINGLPPTPIANPGASAIQAAVDPEETDYLYFVAKRDGLHVFTKTYEDHQKAVRYYQLRKGKKPTFD